MSRKQKISNWEDIPPVVDLRFAANMLQITCHTARADCCKGRIKGQKVGGQWRISKHELMRLCGDLPENCTADYTADKDKPDDIQKQILDVLMRIEEKLGK